MAVKCYEEYCLCGPILNQVQNSWPVTLLKVMFLRLYPRNKENDILVQLNYESKPFRKSHSWFKVL